MSKDQHDKSTSSSTTNTFLGEEEANGSNKDEHLPHQQQIQPSSFGLENILREDNTSSLLPKKTLIEIEKPESMQGESFRSIVNKKGSAWRDAIYYTYYEYPSVHMVKRHYGVRTERYKLMHFYYDIYEWELYDLEKDPSEMNNLYDNPDYLNVQKKLHLRLSELREKYGDSDSLDQMHIKRYIASRKNK